MSIKLSRTDRKKIDQYIIDNPIDRKKPRPYKEVAEKFGVEEEYIRSRCRQVRNNKSSVRHTEEASADTIPKEEWREGYYKFKEVESGAADLTFVTGKRVKTKEELIELAEIDTTKWNIVGCEVTTWEVGRKNKATDMTFQSGTSNGFTVDKGGMLLQTLYRVNIKLTPRKLDEDVVLQKEAVMTELRAYSPIVKNTFDFSPEQSDCLLEIATFDLHLGSMSWGKETGNSYDIKIAEQRFKASVIDLLTQVNLSRVERILFPIGNDLMNIDSKNNMTANGTLVDTDVRFFKMLQVARRIMVETIDELSLIAPVDVVVVPGNHDATVSLVLGEILDAFYHNNEKVTIYGSPRPRKYYEYGKTSIQFTHGDSESHHDLGLIFANEEADLWARTKFRFAQLGHFHKNKKISYLSVDEFQGFQVQILPTLSSETAWADKKGYSSLKQAKAFIFHREKGLRGEFTSTV